MKALVFIAVLLLVSPEGHSSGEKGSFLSEFVIGKFLLIGKAPDSDTTYSGEIEIERTAEGLRVVRTIEGVKTEGVASAEEATLDKVSVLRIRFNAQGAQHEETCLVGSDLDNYARITCYLYKVGVRTMNPGMEAFFINHQALKQ